jgi:preprotein translocase subunit SecY
LAVVIPALEKLQKEGDSGRKKITQWTRYGTIVLGIIQGLGISYGLEQQGVLLPGAGGISFYILTVTTLASGTAVIMWLGEQITERGIGNGISLIIFAGIVTRIPGALRDSWNVKEQFGGLLGFLILLAFIAVVIGVIIFCERGQRRIPINYAKRVVGRKMYSGQTSHLPLKINTSGVIPPIFASSLILFPATIAQFVKNPKIQAMASGLSSGWLHTALYVSLIIFFCYFYTAVMIDPTDVADNIKKYGGYIPGIRPGKRTADYIDRVLVRITLVGAIYVAVVCILPTFLISGLNTPFYFGGTALLIVVGVAKDTMAQIESHLIMRNYSGFLKGARVKGRSDR